jgi:hypothetical protein
MAGLIQLQSAQECRDIADLVDLASNRSAGKVAYWHPAVGGGTTSIDRVSGVLAITARAVRIRLPGL